MKKPSFENLDAAVASIAAPKRTDPDDKDVDLARFIKTGKGTQERIKTVMRTYRIPNWILLEMEKEKHSNKMQGIKNDYNDIVVDALTKRYGKQSAS